VSHESIYRTLFVQSRGALRKELTAHLRTGRVIRRPKGVRLPDGRGGRPNTLHISERPAEVEDRAVPGHWEGDLVFGKGMSPVATLVERSTRFLMLVALPGGNHKADAVADALADAVTTLPQQLTKSLTWDLGHEMAQHQRFTVATGVQRRGCSHTAVTFCRYRFRRPSTDIGTSQARLVGRGASGNRRCSALAGMSRGPAAVGAARRAPVACPAWRHDRELASLRRELARSRRRGWTSQVVPVDPRWDLLLFRCKRTALRRPTSTERPHGRSPLARLPLVANSTSERTGRAPHGSGRRLAVL
jgi:hypothetical protein